MKKISKSELHEILTELMWIFKNSKKYTAPVLFFLLMGLIGIVSGLSNSVVSKTLIDTVTGSSEFPIARAAVLYVAMGVMRIAFKAVSSRYSEKIRQRINTEMRESLFRRIVNAAWEDIAEFSTGDILNRVNDDISAVASGIIGVIPVIATRGIQFVAAFAIIFYFDPVMAGFSLISVPVSILCSRLLLSKMRAHSSDIRKINSRVMAFSEDAIKNLYQIKSFGIVDTFAKRYSALQQESRELNLKYNKLTVVTGVCVSLLGQAVSYLCFAWCVYRLWKNEITFGTVTLFLQLSGSLSGAFSELVNAVPTAITAATAAGRIRALSLLDSDDDAQVEIPPGDIGVGFRNVCFAYKNSENILDNVSLEIKPGEKVVFTGISGEGKTTLLRLLTAVIKPKSGEVYIKCADKSEIPVSPGTRKVFCSVSQNNILFSGTIADNMRLIKPQATDDELLNILELACARDFVEKLPNGIYTLVGEGGVSFSEGQAQRLSIARAMLSDAKVLLFDEATSALDMKTEQSVLENIFKYCRDKTCIFTTHRQSVTDYCDTNYDVAGNSVLSV